jgi:putative peptidoglycan lipid II flippase
MLAGVSKGVLESYKSFVIPALGPVIYNMGFIFGAIVLGRFFGIEGLCVGVVLGAIGNLCIQLPKLTKVGKHLKLSVDIHNEGYKEMMLLMLPALIALAVNRLNLVINQNVVSFLEEGSRTELRYAQRLMMLPVGIFGAAVMTTIFPTMNAQIAREKYEDFKDTLCQGLRNALFLTIPSAVGLMVLNYPVVRLLFLSGKFTEYNVSKTAFALFFYAFGVIGNATVPILIRGFYSRHDTKTPLAVGILVVLSNLVLNVAFVKHTSLGVGGVALTSAAVAFLEMVVLYVILSVKMHGMRTREVLTTVWKACVAAFAMGAAAFIASRFIEDKLGTATKTAQLIEVVVPVGLAILVYFIAASFLRMPELEFFLGALKKKIKKA